MTKKKIIIDMTMLKRPYTGLGQFSLYLGNNLLCLKNDDDEYDFLLYKTNKNIFEKDNFNAKILNKISKHTFKYTAAYLSKKYDLWHILSQQSSFFPISTQSSIIFTIHDLNILKENTNKNNTKAINLIQQRINRADIITSISDYVATDIKNNFDLKNKKIEVIHNGVEIKRYQNPKKPNFIHSHQKIIFTIGALMEKKNFHVLVKMMQYLPDYHLIIAGRKERDYIYQIQNEISDNHLEEKVTLAGEISDEDKYWLYQNCEAFAFPSLLEGFGMPIIEALSMGKPVFCSNSTSLPEVGGEMAYYWDSFEPQYMAEIFKKGIENTKNDALFVQKAIDRANEFSWKIAAEKYLKLYERLLKK